MKKNSNGIFGFLVAAVLPLCVSCGDTADDGLSDGTMTRVALTPGGITDLSAAPVALTPPLAGELKTKGSTFSEGDEIGFFSEGGDSHEGEDGTKGFSNLRLTYDGKSFNNSEEFVRDLGKLGRYFGYYPYTENIETEEGVSVYADEGQTRVTDFLTINYGGSGTDLLGGDWSKNRFFHTFAIVRVKCGEGFENFDKENGKIFLQLRQKVSAVRIDWNGEDTDKDSPFTAVRLVYDESATAKEARRLPAFRTTDGEAWDAIVPCLPMMWKYPDDAKAGGVTIDAIVLKPGDGSDETEIPVDNHEAFQGVLADGNTTHGVRGSFIYTVVIRKEGFDMSVFPYDVEKWEEQDLNETLTAGISSVGEYESFVSTYNSLFNEDREYTQDEILEKANSSEALRKYGTKADDGTFTVFLRSDLDFSDSGNAEGEGGACVRNLVIPFDGGGHTVSGIRMTGGFCGTLRSALKNFRFRNISVIQPPGSEDPVGLLADKMAGEALIGQCSVTNGWIEGKTVGAAVGTMEGGTVKDCSFEGIMRGASDPGSEGLAGKKTGGALEGNRNDMNTTDSE